MWEEIETAEKGQRRELVLHGETLPARYGPKKEIPTKLFTLSSLNVLELSSCPALDKIPADLGKLINLATLIMNKNGITKIPGAAVLKLQKLKVLNLANNKIESCPPEVN